MSKRELEELRDLIEQLFAESSRIFLSQLSGLEFKSEIHFYVHLDDLKHIWAKIARGRNSFSSWKEKSVVSILLTCMPRKEVN